MCSATWLGGCSLTSGFNDYKFGSGGSGNSAADGGGQRDASSPSDGGMVDGAMPSDAGGSDAGAHDAAILTDGGTGDAAADGGGTIDMTCDTDEECGDITTFHCVLRHCLLRRGPSNVWFSGGGGVSQSSGFLMRVSVGTPSPMGVSESKHYSITVGAGAGRP
ncbi:MAG TPA: hypothetical protein VHZ95_14010 [Polyangiales bacterium]|nr:hypothetical protein [Polyangiales bacterium]